MKRVTAKPDTLRIRLGCLDSRLDQKPLVRVFLSEKQGFTEILDDIPSFDTVPGTKPSG